MKRRPLVVWCWAATMVLALGYPAAAAPVGLVGHWTFDEGQGTTAFDSSGNGLDGALRGNPTWVTGPLGGALDFNGSSDYVEVPDHPLLSITQEITIAAWTQMRPTAGGEMAIVSKGRWAANDLPYELTEEAGAVIFWQFYDNEGRDTCSPPSPPVGEWHHIAATYDGHIFKCYIDGVLGEEWAYAGTMPKNSSAVTIGRRSGGGTFFNGMIDDVQLWSRALPEVEVRRIMRGLEDPSLAQDPHPEDAAVDVPLDVVLGWTPGEYAATHDVYLGTTFEDVNTASTADPKGVLAGPGQTAAEFDTEGQLEYGQTYFWRVDEVNAAPDNTLFKGQVWSFTTETFGSPITKVTATASSFNPGTGPENTVNGSGLNANDEHSVELTDMWMSGTAPTPHWIQYEFDKAYKLHELWVWNSNQLIESFVGFGAKEVAVEYSVDGATWTALEGAPEFAQATGMPTYTANTIVSFGGVTARFVRLTINTKWGPAPQASLSEVRFFYVPVQARAPQPATGATGVSVDTDLNWRPGREAESHEVYLGTDANAMTLVGTVAEHGYTPASLQFATTYYWKVNEIGGAGPYEGEVWSFTTQEYAAIDDMENYNDDDKRIFDTWTDGWVNKTGSQVGYDVSPFAERTIVHGGKQSMPLRYNNEPAPFYSEAEREFSPAQDWTAGGADTLSLWVRGNPVDLYVTIEDSAGKKATATNPTPITAADWSHWTIPQGSLTGVNMSQVKKMSLGVGKRTNPVKGSAGIVYVDDIGFGRPLP